MALVAMRQGRGNVDLAGQLLKTVYLAHFLSDVDTMKTSMETFLAAELAIKASIMHALTADEWRIEDADRQSIEVVLLVHDTQLASLPMHQLEAAKRHLSRILESGEFPNLALLAATKTEDNTG